MSSSFMGIVKFNEEGELVCFCYQKDVEAGLCSCRDKFDCPEARIEITTIPGTKPSEAQSRSIDNLNAALKKNLKSTIKNSENIKQGLIELEKSIKRNFRL